MHAMFRPTDQKELSPQEPKRDQDLQFCWGLCKGAVNLYESFTLDGVEYFLYDCVYMWRAGQAEPDIGKLIRIIETENHERKVEVVWFFRPSEIANWLRDVKPLQREIFLACGSGKGLSNLNPLEAISGKCNVVCSSKHKSNSQPTEEEVRMADYIFYRTFDVGEYIISENIPNSIGGIKVDHFFNRRVCANPFFGSEPKAHPKGRSEEAPVSATKNDQPAQVEKGASTSRRTSMSTKDKISAGAKSKRSVHFLPTNSSDINPLKKRKLLLSSAEDRRNAALPYALPRVSGQEKCNISQDSCRGNKDLSTQGSLDKKASKLTEKGLGNKQQLNRGISYKYMEVTRRPHMDSSKWLKLEVWSEARLIEANEKGTLVVLENLDRSFTSAEVEDIVWKVFEQKVTAKMVQGTAISSPHSGQALTIFKTKEAADTVLTELINGCLLLGDERPIVGRRGLRKFGSSGSFFGHLSVNRPKPQRQREEIRNAVATSHFSQGNTIEFELAIEWRLLQLKSDMWWKALYEEQSKEIEALMKQKKIHHQN